MEAVNETIKTSSIDVELEANSLFGYKKIREMELELSIGDDMSDKKPVLFGISK